VHSYKRKYNKIFRTLALGIILALLLVASPAVPTHAADGTIDFYPDEAEIGDWIGIDGYGFNVNKVIHLYFSSESQYR